MNGAAAGSRTVFGDCRESLRRLALEGVRVQMCVTSPPYWRLRSYLLPGHPDKPFELGMEGTPEDYVANLVEVFRLVRGVLADDGTLWLNLGDSYDDDKNLRGMPWRVAFALQADGWVLRQEIIWHKPNPCPESVTDRCTKAHEHLFLLAKNSRYYFDTAAISEEATGNLPGNARHKYVEAFAAGHGGAEHRTKSGLLSYAGRQRARTVGNGRNNRPTKAAPDGVSLSSGRRNRRSVWTIPSAPFRDAHFAVFPPALVEPCILAGSRPGDTVLDPFFGSGTTGAVAQRLGRRCIGLELNREYGRMQDDRTRQAALPL